LECPVNDAKPPSFLTFLIFSHRQCWKERFGKEKRRMDLKINGKVAIVTGAGNGIGRGIALRLAKEEAIVVAADLNGTDAAKVVAEVESTGGKGLALKFDATLEASVNGMFQETLERFGRIDILVNNVGGGAGSSLIVHLSAENFDKTVEVNLKSTFLCSRAAAKDMMKRREGRIINIASIVGKSGESLIGAYSASKFAVIGLTQVMAKELGRYSITVNAVCPGYVWTPAWEKLAQWMKDNFVTLGEKSIEEIFQDRVKAVTPLGRPQSAEDIASLVAYLASEEARNITGQAINVDGGAVMH
jgi:NAD(P)-dependent dehydrogenase (short-subunit alcohol dehydrogenase family)